MPLCRFVGFEGSNEEVNERLDRLCEGKRFLHELDLTEIRGLEYEGHCCGEPRTGTRTRATSVDENALPGNVHAGGVPAIRAATLTRTAPAKPSSVCRP